MNPKEELIGWCPLPQPNLQPAIVAFFSRDAFCRYITSGSLTNPLQKEVTTHPSQLTTRPPLCNHVTLASPQDYWTAHYFWRTWMPELHQQPFVLVVDTVTHGAAHAYVAKQITL